MAAVERLDAVVVGAGVIGLATARALSLAGREVTIVEAESMPGAHTSSRNSEVIHAGIYYPTGSLKARLCVAGKQALYEYCAAREIAHARLGKLIVASRDDEIPVLERLAAHAEANGVHDLSWLDAGEVAALEPAVTAVRALLSPSTGIIDSHGLMTALRADAQRAGAQLVVSTPVIAGRIRDSGIELEFGGPEPMTALCNTVINAAGLEAPRVARSIHGLAPETVPAAHYAKGHYFVLSGRSPFSRLIYPVPVPGGLGVHVTLDLDRRARFGPDVAWVDGIDYGFDETRADAFYAAIRSYFPALADGALAPGYTGIRPKLGPAGSPAQDFVVSGPSEHGVPGLVCCYGIESPGLTACLALADHALTLLTGGTLVGGQ